MASSKFAWVGKPAQRFEGRWQWAVKIPRLGPCRGLWCAGMWVKRGESPKLAWSVLMVAFQLGIRDLHNVGFSHSSAAHGIQAVA